MFAFSTKRENRHFHVVLVQGRQRKVQKSVMHVQSCCFANLYTSIAFCRSRWRRRSSFLKVARLSFLGSIPPQFECYYVDINKDIEKKVTSAVLYKDETFLWFMFYWHKSCLGNIMTLLRFLLGLYLFLGTRIFFCFRERLRELLPPLIASILAKFEQILWERFGSIFKSSFKGHNTSE